MQRRLSKVSWELYPYKFTGFTRHHRGILMLMVERFRPFSALAACRLLRPRCSLAGVACVATRLAVAVCVAWGSATRVSAVVPGKPTN